MAAARPFGELLVLQGAAQMEDGEFGSPPREAEDDDGASAARFAGSTEAGDSNDSGDAPVSTARRVNVAPDGDGGAAVVLASPVGAAAPRTVHAGGSGVVGRPMKKRGVCAVAPPARSVLRSLWTDVDRGLACARRRKRPRRRGYGGFYPLQGPCGRATGVAGSGWRQVRCGTVVRRA